MSNDKQTPPVAGLKRQNNGEHDTQLNEMKKKKGSSYIHTSTCENCGSGVGSGHSTVK